MRFIDFINRARQLNTNNQYKYSTNKSGIIFDFENNDIHHITLWDTTNQIHWVELYFNDNEQIIRVTYFIDNMITYKGNVYKYDITLRTPTDLKEFSREFIDKKSIIHLINKLYRYYFYFPTH